LRKWAKTNYGNEWRPAWARPQLAAGPQMGDAEVNRAVCMDLAASGLGARRPASQTGSQPEQSGGLDLIQELAQLP